MATLRLSGNPEADKLLSDDPLALLIGMVLDQQVPLEWAFAGPAELRRRLGRDLDAREIASMDPDALAAAFSAKPALHRYPGSMAGRVHELCRVIVDDYGGRPEAVWTGVQSGSALLDRIRALPGFGEQKAKIFVALLGKQLGVRPPGWQEVSTPYGDPDTHRSVADIIDQSSLDRVRSFKQDMKAQHKAAAEAAKATAPAGKRAGATKAAPTTRKAAVKKKAGARKKKAGANKKIGANKKAGAVTQAGAAKKSR
jgi:uncharacterized HhH-GPD family protein